MLAFRSIPLSSFKTIAILQNSVSEKMTTFWGE